MEQLLAAVCPQVMRRARALAGRDDVARGVVRFVMSRSLRVMGGWRDAADALRWFHHHTILTVRRAARHAPDARRETLVDSSAPAEYVAFVRAMRALPSQQREALLLIRCEKWDLRTTSIAMDCSTQATEGHLRAAEHTLQALAGEAYPAQLDEMARRYASLTPQEEQYLPDVRGYIRRSLWPRRLRRMATLLGLLAGAAAAAWATRRLGFW